MNSSSSDTRPSTRLFCIVVYDNLKVRDSSFIVTVPSDAYLDSVLTAVLAVTPSLNRVDRSKFKLYKPPTNLPIPCNSVLLEGGGQLTEHHISGRIYLPHRVDEVFPDSEKDDTRRFNIDLIIRVTLEEHHEHGRLLPLL